MENLDALKKFLAIIQKSLPVSDDDNNNNGKVESEEANLMDGTTDEQAIKMLSRDFAKSLNDRDFECLDGRAEYHLYTVDHLIELIKNNDEQNTIGIFNENKIKAKFEDCEFLSVTFSEDLEKATVEYNVKICVISAEEKYFKGLNKKNK